MFEEIYLARIFAWFVFLAIGLVLVGIILRWRRSTEVARNRNRIDDLAIQLGKLRLENETSRAQDMRDRKVLESQIGELRVEHARARLREANARADIAEIHRTNGPKPDSSVIIIPRPDEVRRVIRR